MKLSPPLLILSQPCQIGTKAVPLAIPRHVKSPRSPLRQRSRQFSSTPFDPDLQTLTASRILSYRSSALYDIIADIDSYSKFIPYCTSSRVTSWSDADNNQRSWPQEADLNVGFKGYDEIFRSRVYCVPGSIVEATSGEAQPTVSKNEIPHHTHDSSLGEQHQAGDKIFKSLLTRWTLKEFPFKPLPPDGKTPQEGNASLPSRPVTEVNLMIEVQFANQLYAALSKAAAPKVAGIMIEAFEKRARAMLWEEFGGPGDGERMGSEKRTGALEGAIKGEGMKETP
ncbi:hypothetical protein MMC20_005188 [Loxospora ochrophaea]|nr:hypothetical protein [Loxospora ochrophaea]